MKPINEETMKRFLENYIVTREGEVWNWITLRPLRPRINRGYKRVVLYSGNKRRDFVVHRLVAYTYCEGYAEDLVVNHVDGIKTNNHADNLVWVTPRENSIHSIDTGLQKRKLTPEKIKLATHLIQNGMTRLEVAEYFEIDSSQLSRKIPKDLPGANPRITAKTWQKTKELLSKGYTQQKAANKVGIHLSALERYLRKEREKCRY